MEGVTYLYLGQITDVTRYIQYSPYSQGRKKGGMSNDLV